MYEPDNVDGTAIDVQDQIHSRAGLTGILHHFVDNNGMEWSELSTEIEEAARAAASDPHEVLFHTSYMMRPSNVVFLFPVADHGFFYNYPEHFVLMSEGYWTCRKLTGGYGYNLSDRNQSQDIRGQSGTTTKTNNKERKHREKTQRDIVETQTKKTGKGGQAAKAEAEKLKINRKPASTKGQAQPRSTCCSKTLSRLSPLALSIQRSAARTATS